MNKLITEEEAVQILERGGVVALPTETVYGLACSAKNAAAVARVYQIKNRPADNPLICHFHSVEQLIHYIETPNETEQVLLSHFTPGPLSFLFRLKPDSPLQPATGGRQTLVARIPAHPLFLSILKKLNQPIAAPSANTSGKYSATTAEMVLHDLGHRIDGVVNGGISRAGLESTIIQVTESAVLILRPGVIGPDDIREVLRSANMDKPVIYARSIETTPGSKYKHYAPDTPLRLLNNLSELPNDQPVALLTVDEISISEKSMVDVYSLGSVHQPQQIAANLYRTLFEMDQKKYPVAYLFLPPLSDKHWQHTLQNRIQKMIQHT